MILTKAYKFSIYPNKEQQTLIKKTFGCTRYIYNYYLNKRQDTYINEHTNLTYNRCSADLTQLKKEIDWLNEADGCALQSALQDLDNAYNRFFKKISGYPNFKNKKSNHQSYLTKNTCNSIAVINNKHIKLPKLKVVKCKITQPILGRILNATISQDCDGKYYVSLCCTDIELPIPEKNWKVCWN